jgi:hypothetical protein
MAAFVLDASIAVSWRFPGDPAEETLYRSSRRLVPSEMFTEIRMDLSRSPSCEK